MKAVIVTGGKQYTVSEGDVLFIEKLNAEAEETVKFEQVLAVIDGETAVFGAPVIEGASVTANPQGGYAVSIEFTKKGAEEFYANTASYAISGSYFYAWGKRYTRSIYHPISRRR